MKIIKILLICSVLLLLIPNAFAFNPFYKILGLFVKFSPEITAANVYPEKVRPGDVLLINVTAKDIYGISKVTAKVEHESGFDLIELSRKKGNNYQGTWICHNAKNMQWYDVEIEVTNLQGISSFTTLQYQDPTKSHPAAEVTAGTFDAGNFTFPNSLFVNDKVGIGTTNPGSTLDVNGSFRVVSTNPMSATGGTITNSSGYTIHTFTSNGTFTPNGAGNVEYLVVAGGGGGGKDTGGGGGAGGFRTSTGFAVTAQAYTVTVGAGGVGATSYVNGANGADSVFSTITSTGGGGGAPAGDTGVGGGSGGGGSRTGTGGSGTSGQGNNGGSGTAFLSGAGGGGAGAVGGNAGGDTTSGVGGDGSASSISGSSVYYAGGGGGGSRGTGGAGGLGGGGAGSYDTTATAGTANTGGGGGGGGNDVTSGYNGGAGGSGIVIIRYRFSQNMSIDSYGKVGIGRTPATNDLEVEGTASKTASGDWLANSDKRIKTDIQDINNALNTILKLRPVKFKYTDEYKQAHPSIDDKYYYNFIAQEYQEVFPESVQGSGEYLEGNDKEILQMDSYNAQIVAIKAIQELNAENQALKQQIQQLNQRITALEKD